MLSYSFSSFIILSIIALLGFYIINIQKVETLGRLFLYIFFVGFVIYSGIGICEKSVSDWYFIPFALFLYSFPVSFAMASRFADKFKYHNVKFVSQPLIIKSVALIFWIIMVIRTIYPVNHLANIRSFSLVLQNVGMRNINSAITVLFNYLLLMLRPIYYVYLYRCCSTKKTVILIIVEFFLNTLISGYVARSGFISQVIFLLLTAITKYDLSKVKLYNRGIDLIKKYKKALSVAFVLLLIALPVLYEYQNYRLGMNRSSLSLGAKALGVLSTELTFPALYDFCKQFHSTGYFLNYLMYVITLVIPKSIFGISNTFDLNRIITVAYSGLEPGMMGYSVYLSGLLGEGIVLFGVGFSWLFSIFLGLVLGFIFRLIERHNDHIIYALYLCMNVLTMCRGGSQNTVSLFINGSLLLVLCTLFDGYSVVIGPYGRRKT